jgi:hypothetical protein
MPGPITTNRAMLGIVPLASMGQEAPPAAVQPMAALKPSDEEQISAWLAHKAKHYPEGTAPEQAAAWQDHDRQRYAEILAQRAAAEQQLKIEQDARQRVIDGFLRGIMPPR